VAAETPAEEATEGKAKGGKRKLVLVVVPLVLVLAGAGLFVTGKLPFLGAAAAEESEPAEPEPPAEPDGAIVPLAPITLNLADGHYLKVGLALHLASAKTPPLAEGEDARALDETIRLLGARTKAELITPEGCEAAKGELTAAIAAAFTDRVARVYFTEFVMQ
jgi:flagellar protein FliL